MCGDLIQKNKVVVLECGTAGASQHENTQRAFWPNQRDTAERLKALGEQVFGGS
jgi:hypothetical protein